MSTLGILLVFTSAAAAVDTSEANLVEDVNVFGCSPAVVGPRDEIILRKNAPDRRELSVVRPGARTPHFLVVENAPSKMPQLMSPHDLSQAKEIRISVAKLKGLEWSASAQPELIFDRPGDYEFFLSTTLESEDGGYVCTVKFQGLE
ncbi:MAG: hypothetical protein ABI451_07270 [Dokdonella sp.]